MGKYLALLRESDALVDRLPATSNAEHPGLPSAVRPTAPVTAAPQVVRPSAPCPCCHGRSFWRGSGPWVCSRCHSPAGEPAERFSLPGPAPAAWRSGAVPDARSPLIPDEVREKIGEIEAEARALGWPAELLWNADFWDSPRGLAAILEPDDAITAVTPDYIEVLRLHRDLLRFSRAH